MSDDDEVSDDEEEVEDVKPPTKKPQAKVSDRILISPPQKKFC